MGTSEKELKQRMRKIELSYKIPRAVYCVKSSWLLDEKKRLLQLGFKNLQDVELREALYEELYREYVAPHYRNGEMFHKCR